MPQGIGTYGSQRGRPSKREGKMYGSVARKKAAMGISPMDEEMDNTMRKQMNGGSRMKYNQGSYVSIQDMEKHCSSKTQRNTMK